MVCAAPFDHRLAYASPLMNCVPATVPAPLIAAALPSLAVELRVRSTIPVPADEVACVYPNCVVAEPAATPDVFTPAAWELDPPSVPRSMTLNTGPPIMLPTPMNPATKIPAAWIAARPIAV